VIPSAQSEPTEARTGRRPRQLIILLLKALTSIAIIGFLLNKIDFATLASRLDSGSVLPLAGGIGVGILIIVVSAFRWWGIHHRIGASIPFRFSVPATMECFTLNLLLPGSIGGDVVRAARARRLCGRTREAIMAVLLDRGGNLAALTIMCIAALPFLGASMASRNIEVAVFVLATVGILGVTAVYLAPFLLGRSPLKTWRPTREFIRIGFILRRILHLPRAVCEIAGLSFVIQALNIAMLWAAALAVSQEALPLFTLVIATTFGMLGSALPVSIGGLGVREGAVVWVFLETGLAENTAIMIAILYAVLVLSQTIPGLLVWAFGRLPPILSLTERQTDI
jgi:glycosyltransferase 2 family protein